MSSISEKRPQPTTLSALRLTVDHARITDQVLSHQYPGAGTPESPYIVSFLPSDPGNPFNWSKSYKWTCTMITAVATLSTAFASSAYSGTLRELVTAFDPNPSLELLTAGISLFVLGFAVGPLLWAPLSEIYGRQVIFVITFGAFTAFNAACAGAKNVQSLLVLRFLAAAFGSSPFTNAGGVIADMFDASERGLAMSLFALAPSLGPTLGPFIGGFLGESPIGGWRWVMGLMAIFSGVLWIAQSIVVPETYAPVLLKKRAEKLSTMTGKVYKSAVEVKRGEVSVKAIMVTSLTRPWILLFMEPVRLPS
jgi:multidrug resistance protein